MFNFSGGKKHVLNDSESYQLVTEAWGDNYPWLKNGDTISVSCDDSIIETRKGKFAVRSLHKTQLYHGGKTVKEIQQKAESFRDSVIVPL